MRQNEGLGPLLANAALREHHKILDAALQLEDWTRSEALFLQVCPKCADVDHICIFAGRLFDFQTLACTGKGMKDAGAWLKWS